jgi:hypothetical protein
MSETSLLAACLARLGWSPERLASEINRVCGRGTISSKAPYGWLKGSCPRGRLGIVVARILSERLGERISPEQLWPGRQFNEPGMAAADHGLKGAWTQEAMRECSAVIARKDPPTDLLVIQPLTGTELTAVAVDWLSSPCERLAPQREGQIVSPEMIEALQVRVAQLRRMDDSQGGRAVLDWAVHDLKWVAELVQRGSYEARTGKALHIVVAELAQLAGWLACDNGRYAQAQRYWVLGLRAAHVAGDYAIGANIVSCLSYQATFSGRGREAMNVIKLARSGVRDMPAGTVHALLISRQARAHAALGEAKECERALAIAAEYGQLGAPDVDPPWSYWVTPAVLTADAGRAWLDLGHADRAEEHLVHGLELFGDAQPRNRMLHHASLSEARLARGDVEGAASSAHAAMDLLSQTNSIRGRSRLRSLARTFADRSTLIANEIVDRIAMI